MDCLVGFAGGSSNCQKHYGQAETVMNYCQSIICMAGVNQNDREKIADSVSGSDSQ